MIIYLKKWIAHNFWVKVSVIILAWAVWFMVKAEEDVTYQFNAAVFATVADDMHLVNIDPHRVNVTMVGRRNVMEKLKNRQISISLDLRNREQSQIIHVPITRDKVDAPPEVFIKDIEPDFVDVKIDKGIRKSLTVKEKYTGTPAPEYKLRSVTVAPSVVEVFGPESILKNRSEISTQPFSIDMMDKPFTQRVPLEPFYPGLKELPVVDVYVDIARSLKNKTLNNVKIQIVKSPLQTGIVKIDPAEITIVVEGTESYLQSLDAEDITAFVHISNLKEGKYELPIRTMIPDDYNIVSIEPEVAEVSIGLMKIEGK